MENQQPIQDSDKEQPDLQRDHKHLSRQMYKSPSLAGVLSMLPGLGQVYVGYYKQGFYHIAIFAITIACISALEHSGFIPILGIFLPFFWIFNILDAVRRAKISNMIIDGVSQIELPGDFELPKFGGSTAGGVILIILGAVIFLNTMFGFSFAWLENWWPLALVGGGIYLIYKNKKEKTA